MADLESVAIPEEISGIVLVQQTLSGLDDSNIDNSIIQIMESYYFTNEENHETLCDEIFYAISIRSTQIFLFVKLCAALIANEKMGEAFKAKLIDGAVEHDSPQLLHLLIEKGVIDKALLKKRICSYKFQIYFEEFNEDSVLWDLPVFEEKKNYEEKLKDLREKCWTKDNPVYAIKNDDVSGLQKFADNPDFKFDQTVEWSIFEVDEAPEDVSLLGVAAFFGSRLCFDFISVSGGGEITESIANNAVAGGNLEIIKACGDKVAECAKTAIRFHRPTILAFISTLKKELELSIIDAISFHNFVVLNYLISKGADVNKFEMVGEKSITPLQLAVQHHRKDILKFLLDHGANPDATNVQVI